MQHDGSELLRNSSLASLSKLLRWRQFITSLIIIATILIACITYYYFQSQQRTAFISRQGQEMAKNGQDILVSISLHKELGMFVIDNEIISNKEFESFLVENRFSIGSIERDQEYFGYIQSIKSGAIAWSTKHAFEQPVNNKSPYATLKKTDFPIFSVRTEANEDFACLLSPTFSPGRNPNPSRPQYIVRAVGFTFEGTAFQLILAKDASQIPVNGELSKQDLTWLILVTGLLVLIAQLVISYAVFSPLQKVNDDSEM